MSRFLWFLREWEERKTCAEHESPSTCHAPWIAAGCGWRSAAEGLYAAVEGLKSLHLHVPDTIVKKSQSQLHSAADKVLHQFTMFLEFEFIDECTCSARRSGVFSSRAWPVQEMKTQGTWMVSLRMKIGEVGSMTETKPKR